ERAAARQRRPARLRTEGRNSVLQTERRKKRVNRRVASEEKFTKKELSATGFLALYPYSTGCFSRTKRTSRRLNLCWTHIIFAIRASCNARESTEKSQWTDWICSFFR